MISIQYLKDTTSSTIIKAVGYNLSNPETYTIEAKKLSNALNTNHQLLYPNGSSGAVNGTPLSYYDLTFYRIWYDINQSGTGRVDLSWAGDVSANDKPIMSVSWSGDFNTEGNWAAINNSNKNIGNGDVVITSHDVSAFTIIFEVVKDNIYFNSGELQDPEAFNYGKYGITP